MQKASCKAQERPPRRGAAVPAAVSGLCVARAWPINRPKNTLFFSQNMPEPNCFSIYLRKVTRNHTGLKTAITALFSRACRAFNFFGCWVYKPSGRAFPGNAGGGTFSLMGQLMAAAPLKTLKPHQQLSGGMKTSNLCSCERNNPGGTPETRQGASLLPRGPEIPASLSLFARRGWID